MPETVLVTGGTGFVARYCIAELLKRGHTVHATTRKIPDPNPYESGVTWFVADLLTEGAFDEAIKGCTSVLHTASPYTMTFDDAQKDLVDPAVKGTTNVLHTCARTPDLRRVVLTSSVAAITDSPKPEHTYTEADWNEESSLDRNPYYYSKAMAERAAWDFVEKLKDDAEAVSKFDLVTINPVVVFGAEDGTSVNQSNKILQGVLEGEYPALMDLAWAIVDVRDVATAHVEALEREGAEGRHLCGNVTLRMHELVTMIRDQFPDHAGNLPTMDLSGKFGNCIAKIAANFQPKPVKSFLKTNLGRPIEIDNSKIKSSLAMDFIPAEETIRETVQSLIDRGLVPKAQAKADKAAAKSKKGKGADDDDKGKDAAEANSK